MEIREAKEILKAGLTWANWTDEQKEAMSVAYKSMNDIEKVKHFCVDSSICKTNIQPNEILDLIK